MSERKCDVCGELLKLDKNKTYLVGGNILLTGEPTQYDAIDCEKCGCQIILKERRPRINNEQTENSSSNVERRFGQCKRSNWEFFR